MLVAGPATSRSSDQQADLHLITFANMLESELIKRVDDLLRQELLNLGWDYAETVDRLEESGRGEVVVIHFHGNHQAIEIAKPEEDVTDETFSSQIRRRLKVALEGPPPFAEPIEDFE